MKALRFQTVGDIRNPRPPFGGGGEDRRRRTRRKNKNKNKNKKKKKKKKILRILTMTIILTTVAPMNQISIDSVLTAPNVSPPR